MEPNRKADDHVSLSYVIHPCVNIFTHFLNHT